MKKLLSTFLFLATLTIAKLLHGQVAPSIEWQKCFGGSSEEVAVSIQQTLDGGYVVAGSTLSNDGEVSGNHGLDDYWITKLDSAGNLEWQKSLGGNLSDLATSIQQTADSGFIVAGESWSLGGDVTVHHGLYYDDCWIVKLNALGNLVWQKSLGGSYYDYASTIQQTTDGGFIFAAETYSTDGDVLVNHGLSDYWIVKLDSSGVLAWQKSLGGSLVDVPYSIQQTSDGGFIAAGSSRSTDGDASGNHGLTDYWIVKLDTVGNLLWQKSFGGTGYEQAYFIQQTTDGGFIVAGYTFSLDGDVTGHHGLYADDGWIIKLDGNGNLLWQKCLGGSFEEEAYFVQETADGSGFIVAGYASSDDGDVSGNHGNYDYWIAKLDTNGNLLWQESLGGSDIDKAFSIRQTMDGGYVIAGASLSNNNDVTGNHGHADYWIVKLFPDTATGIASPSTILLPLFPNPAQSFLIVNLPPHPDDLSLAVYNAQGRKMFLPITFSNNQAQVNTAELPGGFYTLQIINSQTGESEAAKFVK